MCTSRTTIAMLACTALAVSACGSSATGATTARPATPVNLTVYIDDNRVSVSPSSVGAGPVDFIITNQASNAESLAILRTGAAAGQSLATTGPINPQGTAQVTINFSSPGRYSLATSGGGQGSVSGIRAASLRIGPRRTDSNHQLLQP
jgi:hypothetical protein